MIKPREGKRREREGDVSNVHDEKENAEALALKSVKDMRRGAL